MTRRRPRRQPSPFLATIMCSRPRVAPREVRAAYDLGREVQRVLGNAKPAPDVWKALSDGLSVGWMLALRHLDDDDEWRNEIEQVLDQIHRGDTGPLSPRDA